MEKKIPGVLIGALKSGSGKTVITCALLQAMKEMGKNPAAFKCGPDYIDPMFHKNILGVPSYNLDSFFWENAGLRKIFETNAGNCGIAVLEGVMGLYDGLGGIREEGSAYEAAGILKMPVILVADAHGMGRSILPQLYGMLAYDKEKLIKGVILNRISKGFFETLKPEIEKELAIPVLGYFPKQEGLQLESRHLGLKMPEEIENLKEQVKSAAAVLKETVDLEKILKIAEETTLYEVTAKISPENEADEINPEVKTVFSGKDKVKIAVARDEVFCFYYEDNLHLLEEMGAELAFFSPLKDKKLPEDADGLLLGGGYPELKAKELSKNESMRNSIKEALENGMPSVAECGGFMYLHRNIVTAQNENFPLCGVIDAECFYTGKLVRFGYVTLSEKNSVFWSKGKGIPAHEFHYYDSSANGSDAHAVKPVGGRSWECVHITENHWWGYPHLYYPANPAFPAHFVEMAYRYKEHRRKIGKKD